MRGVRNQVPCRLAHFWANSNQGQHWYVAGSAGRVAEPQRDIAMRTRLAIFPAVALLLLLAGALVPVAFPPPSPVTKAAFEKIEMGMTLEDVEAMFGSPAGQ